MTAALIFSGSGTGLAAQAGAYDALLQRGYDFTATGGTSGGGLLALAIAAGRPVRDLRDDLTGFLVRKDLLDLSLRPWDRFGLFAGDRIYGFLRDYFGPTTMSGLIKPCRVTACDLVTGQRVIFGNDTHPKVKVYDVARATMAIPLLFKAHAIGAGLYVDGGVNANFPLGICD